LGIIVVGVILVVVGLIFAVLTARSRRAKNPLARWGGAVVAALLTLVFALVGVVDLVGVYRLDGPRGNPIGAVKVSATEAQFARGERLAILCSSCHSTTGNLPLDGGKVSMLSNPDGSGLGTLYPPNLTPGGPLKTWSDGEIIRAIREGVDKDGHALIVMPSAGFHEMSDDDVQALVTYLRSQPAVDHATPPRNIGLIGTLLIGAGLFPTSAQPPITQPVSAPPPGVNADHGLYLVAIAGCHECHGPALAGGRANGGGPPPGPNLTQIVPKWSEDQFVRTIRTGTDPAGYTLRAELMPWKQFSAAYSDDELKAIYADLYGLKPIASGGAAGGAQ
jgi:mono/diheme cytochrome c family protein